MSLFFSLAFLSFFLWVSHAGVEWNFLIEYRRAYLSHRRKAASIQCCSDNAAGVRAANDNKQRPNALSQHFLRRRWRSHLIRYRFFCHSRRITLMTDTSSAGNALVFYFSMITIFRCSLSWELYFSFFSLHSPSERWPKKRSALSSICI